MLELAAILSKDIPHIRIDFYVVGEKIYVGEFTFFDSGGFSPFTPVEWDHKLGQWLAMPEKYKKD